MPWELFDEGKEKTYGPFTDAELKRQIRDGLKETIQVREVGAEAWGPLRENPVYLDVSGLGKRRAEAEAAVQAAAEPPKKKSYLLVRAFLWTIFGLFFGLLVGEYHPLVQDRLHELLCREPWSACRAEIAANHAKGGAVIGFLLGVINHLLLERQK
jgi:hypothetical protein